MLYHHYSRKRIWRRFTGFIAIVALALALSGCREAPKVYRVGIIAGFDSFLKIIDGFKAGMTELGYIEGQDIIYDIRRVDADPVGMQHSARKFVEDNVDLILAFPTEPSVAAKAATQGTTIPVVFANANIEGSELVESVRQPGGNITGVRTLLSENTVKRLEILIEMVPQATRIYIPYDVNYPGFADILDDMRLAAASANIVLVETPATTLDDIKADLEARAVADDPGIDAILIMPTRLPVSVEGFTLLNTFATEHNLPVAGTLPFMTDQGALFNFALDHFGAGRLAAPLADKIFQGTPAGTIPVVTAELVLRINYTRVQELGITVNEGLLKMANEVIR